MQPLFQNGHEPIDGDGAPTLAAQGVLARALEGFAAQRLLDPFEAPFDLPAPRIELGNPPCGDGEVVGQQDPRLAGFGVALTEAAPPVGRISPGVTANGHHGLVKAQAGGFVHAPGVAAGAAEVFLGAGDEASGALFHAPSVGRRTGRGTVRKWGVCGHGSCRGNGRHTCRTRIWAGSRGVGRRRCDLRS